MPAPERDLLRITLALFFISASMALASSGVSVLPATRSCTGVRQYCMLSTNSRCRLVALILPGEKM